MIRVDKTKYPKERQIRIVPKAQIKNDTVLISLNLGDEHISEMFVPIETYKDREKLLKLISETMELLGFKPKEGYERRFRWAK